LIAGAASLVGSVSRPLDAAAKPGSGSLLTIIPLSVEERLGGIARVGALMVHKDIGAPNARNSK